MQSSNVHLLIEFSFQRSILNQLGRGPIGNRPFNYAPPVRTRVFQRLGYANRRRGGGGNNMGGNPYLFGGQSGLGVRLRGQGRVGGRMCDYLFALVS